jgi:hypothetical protein
VLFEPVECVGGSLVTFTGFFRQRGRDLVNKCWGYSAIVAELLGVGWWLLLCCVVTFCSVYAIIGVDEMVKLPPTHSTGSNSTYS